MMGPKQLLLLQLRSCSVNKPKASKIYFEIYEKVSYKETLNKITGKHYFFKYRWIQLKFAKSRLPSRLEAGS